MMRTRGQRWRMLMLALAVCACGAGPVLALPGRGGSPSDGIQPQVTRRPYERFVQRLEMDDDQRVVAELIYGDYAAALAALGDRVDARAETAGRQRVADALAGTIFVEPGELRRMRIAVLETERSVWDDADHLLDELILNTRSLLFDESAVDLAAAMRELRRAVYLHPRRAEELDATYAGDGVDVIVLVDEAVTEDGELAGLDRTAVEEMLGAYEQRLDAFLQATCEAHRLGELNHAIARIERDREALRREERAHVERWQRLYRLNQDAVNAVAAEAGRQLGSAARAAWLGRFDRACFPWLYRATTPDKQRDWIARHPGEDATAAQAAEIHAQYRAEYEALCAKAVGLIVKGRIAGRMMLSSRMDPATIEDGAARELYQDLLRNSGKRAKLDADTSAALESLLSDRRRTQMRADIAAASYGRRRP